MGKGVNMKPEIILNEAKNISDILVKERRFLHKNPEIEFDLKNTISFVKKELTDMGITPVDCGKAGIVANIGNGNGKTFLLRADMDALPIKEKSDVDFASTNGNMHGCGHDMHTAMLLGAARILKAHESEINGTVKLMLQSAEEIFEGSTDMINAGVLDNPTVDAAMMIHVMAGMPLPSGSAIVSPVGVSAPAADYFEIKVQGKGCHGSMPNTGVDPITIASHIVINLQEINARELAIGDRAVLTIGKISAGTASNAIPDEAILGGSLRTYDEETRGFIKDRIVDMCNSTAMAFRGECEVVFGSGCPTLINDEKMCTCVEKYIKELLGDNKAFSATEFAKASGGGQLGKSAGSEDFAYISHRVPSVMIALAAGEPDKGYKYPQHHPMVKFDEAVLPVGSAIFAYTAIKWLENNGK